MFTIGEYLVNPAHVLAVKFEGEAAVRVYLSAPLGETRRSILHRCDSPDDRSSFADALVEAVEEVNGVRT